MITTDTPGCRETVTQNDANGAAGTAGTGTTLNLTIGRNGVLVHPRDVPALTEAMLILAGDPEWRERMGRESRRLAEQKFVHMTLRSDGANRGVSSVSTASSSAPMRAK